MVPPSAAADVADDTYSGAAGKEKFRLIYRIGRAPILSPWAFILSCF